MGRLRQGNWLVIVIGIFLFVSPVPLSSQQSRAAAVRIDNDDIGGVVMGANGPEREYG